MEHTYHIHGMTCQGCRKHVEELLSEVEGVSSASVDLEKKQARISMSSHVPMDRLKEVLEKDGGRYSIHKEGESVREKAEKKKETQGKGSGTFYCPMQCEGDKTYAEWIWWKSRDYQPVVLLNNGPVPCILR